MPDRGAASFVTISFIDTYDKDGIRDIARLYRIVGLRNIEGALPDIAEQVNNRDVNDLINRVINHDRITGYYRIINIMEKQVILVILIELLNTLGK